VIILAELVKLQTLSMQSGDLIGGRALAMVDYERWPKCGVSFETKKKRPQVVTPAVGPIALNTLGGVFQHPLGGT